MEEQFRTEQRKRWVAKLRRNIERDREVTERLSGEGWTVLRFWASEVQQELDVVIDCIVSNWDEDVTSVRVSN
jgi:DNA mismatch endonuclease (patch repair protein)